MSERVKVGILIAVLACSTIALFSFPPIPQPESYHHFADSRTLLGVPNGLNTLGNAAFLLVAVTAFFAFAQGRARFPDASERWPWIVLFSGVALTCFGSGYYHWAPDSQRLVWDRLPMALGFMGLLAAMIAERVSVRAGLRLLAPLLAVGVGSVIWWQRTNDLRPYALVQFGTLLAVVMLIALFPARYTHTADVFISVGIYALAKVFEAYDRPIFAASGNTVSGHTIKHLVAAVSVWWLLRMLEKRRPISASLS